MGWFILAILGGLMIGVFIGLMIVGHQDNTVIMSKDEYTEMQSAIDHLELLEKSDLRRK